MNNRIRISPESSKSVWDLIQDYNSQRIVVPECQRPWAWAGKRGLKKQQRLIDSIINGYPIPSVILNRREDRILEIYDGRHRVQTMAEFREDKFKWDGMLYSELSAEERARFDDRAIPATITIEATEEQLAEIFIRLQEGQPLTDSDKLWVRRHSPVVAATIRLILGSERLSVALGGVDMSNRRDLANWVALMLGIVTETPGNMTTSYVRSAGHLDTLVDDNKVLPVLEALLSVLERANEHFPATNTEKKRLKNIGRFSAFFVADYLKTPTDATRDKWVDIIRRLRGSKSEREDMTGALTTTGAQNLTARKIEQVLEQVDILLSGGIVNPVEDIDEEDSE